MVVPSFSLKAWKGVLLVPSLCALAAPNAVLAGAPKAPVAGALVLPKPVPAEVFPNMPVPVVVPVPVPLPKAGLGAEPKKLPVGLELPPPKGDALCVGLPPKPLKAVGFPAVEAVPPKRLPPVEAGVVEKAEV